MEPGLDKNTKISQRIEKKKKHKCSKQQREALREEKNPQWIICVVFCTSRMGISKEKFVQNAS
jgi:hypothetical protein